MLSVKGVYENGEVRLKEKIPTPGEGEVPVIVTFLEEIAEEKPRKLDLNQFSFNRSKKLLKDYKGSLSEAVIEERRSYV